MNFTDLIEAIKKQQMPLLAKDNRAAWQIGEQIKDICMREPRSAELVYQDIDKPGMGLEDVAKKFDEYARKKQKNRFYCITPSEAEQIIRDFYGLDAAPAKEAPKPAASPIAEEVDLDDFLI